MKDIPEDEEEEEEEKKTTFILNSHSVTNTGNY